MASKLITGATFPGLQSRLLEDLRRPGPADGLAPKWVVVPSASLANHLRAELARGAESESFANVRVVNLPRFAQRLCACLSKTTPNPWNPLLDLLLWELVEDVPPNSPLAALRTISGGPGMLRAAFTDLAESGFGPGELEKLAELANQPELAPRDGDLLRLYARWVQLLEKRNVVWAPLALQRLPEDIEKATDQELAAALGAEEGQQPTIYAYGFYDWIDVHLEWLSALSRRVETLVYYPWAGEKGKAHPVFSFAESVLQDLRLRFAFANESSAGEGGSGPEEFFLATFPEGNISQKPAFLSYQRAAGARAEAVSAAVRIRTWLDDKNDPLVPEDILVVAPQANAYAESVQEVFAAFAIPLRVSDVASGLTPESAALRMLARVWEEQAPAEWVLGLLRACPNLPITQKVDVDRFESKVRELGIWGGSAWRTALKQEKFSAEDEDLGRRQVQFNQAERALIQEILWFVPNGTAGTATRVPVKGALDTLHRLRDRWMIDPAPLAPLIAATEQIARYRPSLEIELRQWTQLVADGDGARTQRDPMSRAVLFLPLMRARGVTARAVVILGLAAGQIPFRVPDDPLLSELASARLAQVANQIGHRMPMKARLTEELLLLFFLINTAGQRVHWIVPETDAAGKAVAPTPWIQRYLHRWESRAKEAAHEDPLARRIARAPFEQAVYLAGLEPERGELLPPALALFVAPELAASCDLSATHSFLWESAARRGKEPEWSGCILSRPSFNHNSVSVTGLEALARCPFRFYGELVARWEALEALSLSHDLDALARGTLLHKLLEEAVRPYLQKCSMAEIAAEMLKKECAALRSLAQQLPALAPDVSFALAALPEVFRGAAQRQIVEMAATYFEWVKAHPAVPQAVEQGFEKEFPGLDGLKVVGKIDRIDLNGATVELVDFKTGKLPGTYRKAVKLGWQIQAVLYPWLSEKTGASFRYIFLGRAEPEEGDPKGAPEANGFLRELSALLSLGQFIPTSNQVMEELGFEQVSPCNYCAFVSACRRFEPGAAAKHARLFRELAPGRCASLLAAVGGNDDPGGGKAKPEAGAPRAKLKKKT